MHIYRSKYPLGKGHISHRMGKGKSLTQKCQKRSVPWRENMYSHRIHVWHINPFLVDVYGKCRSIYQSHGSYVIRALPSTSAVLKAKRTTIHPGKLTWNPKNEGLVQMFFLSNKYVFSFQPVSFPDCTPAQFSAQSENDVTPPNSTVWIRNVLGFRTNFA